MAGELAGIGQFSVREFSDAGTGTRSGAGRTVRHFQSQLLIPKSVSGMEARKADYRVGFIAGEAAGFAFGVELEDGVARNVATPLKPGPPPFVKLRAIALGDEGGCKVRLLK